MELPSPRSGSNTGLFVQAVTSTPTKKESPVRVFIVDAFADQPFTGNQAAVCLLDQAKNEAWLQAFAAEMNFSETAYLEPRNDGYHLRWFTPSFEVDLCGHATLASAHVLWAEVGYPNPQIDFMTRSGILIARESCGRIELDFPATPPSECAPPVDLLPALGLSAASYIGKSKFDHLVVIDDEQQLRGLTPDFARLKAIKTRGVIVTAACHQGPYDFISRFFAPSVGIDEDPVTGSAHCCLAPYWAARLGKTTMSGYQASERGGVVRVELSDARALLGGTAFTIVRGELAIDSYRRQAPLKP